MATKLIKPINRELIRLRATKKGRLCDEHEGGRSIVVTLTPYETIIFRIKGMRKMVECHLHTVYALAQIVTSEQDFKERLKKYKERKALGFKCRKPKKMSLPYSKFLYKAF